MKNNLKLPLRGIIPPLATPLLDNGELDLTGLKKLIEHVISGGVHGIFILGSTGEFAGLSIKIKHELIKNTCKIVNSRIPVLVGISDCSFVESINLAMIAANCGADAAVTVPPFYFSASQEDLLSYLKNMAKQLPLPLFLYNIPMHTKIEFAPETVKSAAKIPGIVGIKDTSFNASYLKKIQFLLKDRTDFTYLLGPEEYLPDFILGGGHGGVNGGANIFPKLYVDLFQATVDHNLERINKLHKKVLQINATIYTVGHASSSYLKGVKTSLSLLGICSDKMTEPFQRFNTHERNKIQQALEDLNYKELLQKI